MWASGRRKTPRSLGRRNDGPWALATTRLIRRFGETANLGESRRARTVRRRYAVPAVDRSIECDECDPAGERYFFIPADFFASSTNRSYSPDSGKYLGAYLPPSFSNCTWAISYFSARLATRAYKVRSSMLSGLAFRSRSESGLNRGPNRWLGVVLPHPGRITGGGRSDHRRIREVEIQNCVRNLPLQVL